MTKEEKKKILELRANGKGYGMIAVELGVSKNTVASFLKRNKACLSDEIKEGCCLNCDSIIQILPKKKQRKFCSDSCRMSWWNKNIGNVKKNAFYTIECKNCSKNFEAYGNKDRKFCSFDCYNSYRLKKGVNDE